MPSASSTERFSGASSLSSRSSPECRFVLNVLAPHRQPRCRRGRKRTVLTKPEDIEDLEDAAAPLFWDGPQASGICSRQDRQETSRMAVDFLCVLGALGERIYGNVFQCLRTMERLSTGTIACATFLQHQGVAERRAQAGLPVSRFGGNAGVTFRTGASPARWGRSPGGPGNRAGSGRWRPRC